jgi:hypothetical protein
MALIFIAEISRPNIADISADAVVFGDEREDIEQAVDVIFGLVFAKIFVAIAVNGEGVGLRFR